MSLLSLQSNVHFPLAVKSTPQRYHRFLKNVCVSFVEIHIYLQDQVNNLPVAILKNQTHQTSPPLHHHQILQHHLLTFLLKWRTSFHLYALLMRFLFLKSQLLLISQLQMLLSIQKDLLFLFPYFNHEIIT